MMRILIVGDYYPCGRIKEQLDSSKKDFISKDITEIIQSADLSIVNYESPMTEGTECFPIEKSGSTLCSNKKAIDYIKTIGFDLATLANNHTSDYGREGLLNTISYLNKKGIATVGAGKNLKEASKIYYYKNETAIINCCEHEFGIAEENIAGANPLNAIQQYYQIKEARKHTKYVIVIVHGGFEYFQYPTPRMKKLYRFFIDVGADVVVNAHQHCYSGYELYHGKLIFYGLGNFCFDREGRPPSWNYGYMIVLKLSEIIEFDIFPYSQCVKEPVVELLEGKKKVYFSNDIAHLNSIISDDVKLLHIYKKWVADNDSAYRYLMKPFHTRRGFFSWFKDVLTLYQNKRIKEEFLNSIRCESHQERMIYCLDN